MKCLFIGFIFLIIGQSSFGQKEYTFRLVDKKSGNPIEYAFVFLENTSIGTSTDENGMAVLDIQNEQEFTVVFTHLLYETYSIEHHSLSSDPNLIELNEKALSLEEVTVKTRKGNQRKRKKWLRQFEKAFIGEKVSSRRVKLLNPDVIWFEEDDDALYAYAVDNIKVLNKDLGYELLVALEEFSVSSEEDIKYTGKLFFKDLLNEMKGREKIEEKREKSFLQSKRLFFRSLIHEHPVNDKMYAFGVTSPKGGDSLAYIPYEFSELNWKYGNSADTLIEFDYLTVINKYRSFRSFVSRGSSGKSYKSTPATSFLKSRTGKFIISHDGYLLNPRDIEESGYWTSFRMAMELPKNYTAGIIFNTGSGNSRIGQLLSYQKEYVPEKIYIHTNKSLFSPFETLWMKGFLVDGINHSLATNSSVVYVDLIDQKDKIIESWILHKDKGFNADFKWNPNHKTGKYRLRAYTNYMRNQGENYFFEKPIFLLDLITETSNEIEPIDEKKQETLIVDFYPEGGDLISGLNSQVTFHAKTNNGDFVELAGSIQSTDGDRVTYVNTLHKGIGLFHITPKEGKKYIFVTEYLGKELNFDLPQSQPSGLTLSVNPNNDSDILITVASNNNDLLENSFLIGHVRGDIKVYETNLRNNQALKISKSSLPPGIVHFTLFDGKERPHSERLVFNDIEYHDSLVEWSLPESNTNSGQINVKLKLDSNIVEEEIDLSLVIQNGDYFNISEDQMDIKSYLLIQSDLNVTVPGIGNYFKEDVKAGRYYLDLVMRCNQWRRFTWKNLSTDENLDLTYKAEDGYSINGFTTKKEDSTRIKSKIMINSLGPDLYYDNIVTDDFGYFSFDNIPYYDSINYILQGRIDNGKTESNPDVSKIDGNRLLEIHLNDFAPLNGRYKRQVFLNDNMNNTLSKEMVSDLQESYQWKLQNDTSIWSLDIDDIQIRSTRPYTTNRPTGTGKFVNLDQADWVTPELSGTRLLTKIAPSRSYYSGAEGKLYSIIVNRKGEIVYVPMQIVIDGMGAEPGGSNSVPFLNLNADQIETIYVGKAFVSIKTRNIPRSRERYLESGILHFTHPGYYNAREFAEPDFSNSSDKLKYETLLWAPNLKVDDSGYSEFSFPSLPSSASYIARLEGITSSGKIINSSFEISGLQQ